MKTLWADSHTALGIIGLPYQLMFALTGALLGFHVIFFMVYAEVFYDGDQEAFCPNQKIRLN